MTSKVTTHHLVSVFLAFAFAALGNSVQAADFLEGIPIEAEHDVSYNRQRDYGGWATPEPCMSTRMVVLRDQSEPSKIKIRTKPNGSCEVWLGEWQEPYVGYVTTDPRNLQIDHLVPLKEAHRSGAFQWTKEKRREYANWLEDKLHLLAVDGSANMQKGDKDPAKWQPANDNFRCTYLRKWVEVKRKWQLSMDEAEASAVRMGLAACP